MKILNIMKLHGRNILGAFVGGFSILDYTYKEDDDPVLGLFLTLLVLPFNLTIVPAFKTFFDVITRYSLSKKQISNLETRIQNMDAADFADLKTNIYNSHHYDSKFRSNSSRGLIATLFEKGSYNTSDFLSEEDMVRADKDVVLNYIKAEHNNGKRLLLSLYLLSRGKDLVDNQDLFAAAATKQISRLREQGASFFGIGNNKKACSVQIALNEYIKNKTEINRHKVVMALNKPRLALTNKHDNTLTKGAGKVVKIWENLKTQDQQGSEFPRTNPS